MLNSLKQAGRNIECSISHTWENLSEGWRELLSRNSRALAHFSRNKDDTKAENGALATFPRWSLLAGEAEEAGKEILVRVEVPGMDRKDCRITIEDNVLYVSGNKPYERETRDSTYHVMERAYGSFRRSIPLPRNVDADNAEASYRNGVLHIRLPKVDGDNGRTVRVT